MSGQIIGQLAGQIIGGIVAGPIGAAIGGAVGGAVGSSFDSLPTQYGPRLDDLRVQRSEYGAPIPIIYGTVALQGNVIWAQDIKEVVSETEQGGKGGPSQTTVNYSYYGNFAVAICEGPIGGVLRIWAGPEKRLIYDGVALEGGNVRFYLGTEEQMPDPLIEADKGVGFAPAYRGTAYAVFKDLPLLRDGNRLPFLTFEVTTGDDAGTCGVDYVTVGEFPNQARLYDRPPEKLGNMGPLQIAFYGHATATDSDANIYIVARDANYDWHLKKVSSRSPIQESSIPLGSAYHSVLQCKIAYDPVANVIGVIQADTKNFTLVDCASFSIAQYSQLNFEKHDIVYSTSEGMFRFLNSSVQFVGGALDDDCWGVTHVYAGAQLIDCGSYGIAAAVGYPAIRNWTETLLNGSKITDLCADFYDPVRKRLVAISGTNYEGFTGYYDFATGETVVPVDGGAENRLNIVYSPVIDRIFYEAGGKINVVNPADLSPASFPDLCMLVGSRLVYADGVTPVEMLGFYYVIPLPGVRNKIAIVTGGTGVDIFTFTLGTSGAGVTLASVVANLSDRGGESRYDVSQLESDIVDGYVIARQMTVRAAIDALRPVYYYDATESQGLIKYVKRGGSPVAVIDDDDLAARDAGGETQDPLKTVRRMEVELPRAFNVKYLLAADDYNMAAKQARRLIGSSGDEQTIDVPLVLTDTKAQEVAEVNLHASWAERLGYEFSLPRKYADLEPTDVIVVKGHSMRLTKITDTPRGVRQCEAVSDESTYYTPHVVVSETPPNGGTVSQPGVTLLELF